MSIKEFLYKLSAPFLRKLFEGKLTSKKLSGTDLRLYYDKGQHLNFLFGRSINYESNISKIILDHIHNGDLVFELGSNIGQYALLISQKIGTKGRLICVEPDADNSSFLLANVEKNNLHNVTVLCKAVSNSAGKVTFYKDTITGGRMGSLIRQYTGDRFEGRSEIVETITLSELLHAYGEPDFIKVDVEGAEDRIFYDDAVISFRTKYMIEVRAETKTKIYSLFNEKGFSTFLLGKEIKGIRSHDEIPDFANLLFTHSKFNLNHIN